MENNVERLFMHLKTFFTLDTFIAINGFIDGYIDLGGSTEKAKDWCKSESYHIWEFVTKNYLQYAVIYCNIGAMLKLNIDAEDDVVLPIEKYMEAICARLRTISRDKYLKDFVPIRMMSSWYRK